MRQQRSDRGFTVVELLIAVAIFTIGVTGLIALQQVTVVSNKHSKNLALATRIGSTWIEQLAADATLWNRTGLGNTDWLEDLAGLAGGWSRPAWSDRRQIGAAFDAQGNPLDDQDANQAAFCVNLAVTRLFPSNGPNGPNGLLRAEVRVFWRKDSGDLQLDSPFCTAAITANQISTAAAGDPRVLHFVHLATAVRQAP